MTIHKRDIDDKRIQANLAPDEDEHSNKALSRLRERVKPDGGLHNEIIPSAKVDGL